ncbi:MAG: ATPase, T2SS/T4P/T4SS family [archaeon]
MKIGGFEVGPYVVKDEGGKRMLIIDARDAFYTPSIADDRNARYHVLKVLSEVEADIVVLAEVYERVYDEKQTQMLSEIASLYQKFEVENIWSYAHLGDPKKESEKDFGERHNIIVRITHDELLFDPILSYIRLLQQISNERQRLDSVPAEQRTQLFLSTLMHVKEKFESTELIKKSKVILSKLEKVPDTNELYRSFFEAQVKPSFIGSRLVFGEEEQLELLDEYSVKDATVQIFKHPNKVEKLYFVNLPEYSLFPEKYFLLSKTKETVATYKPGRASLSEVAKSRRYFERIYQSTIRDIAKHENISITNDEIIDLSQIVARYTVGYGVLEILLSDRRITDIYIDSPIGDKRIYLVHSEFGQCQTNIIYTQEEADSFSSKLRAMSGRPFDEAHPVLDFDLPDLETRVAAIGPPLAPDGTAFAFRLHKTTPWTLAQFVDVKYLPPLAAGLLSFFVDQQATMLVTGSRGSGKTSLMSSLMLEISQNSRIIVQEDSVTADSMLLVERNGFMEKTTVGELIDGMLERHGFETLNGVEVLPSNPEGIRLYSMDKKGKMRLAPPSQFSRHKVSKDIFEITARTGRRIKVTGDHSLFGLIDNKISPVKCNELHKGSYVATPRAIPWEMGGINEFNLLDYPDVFEKGYVSGKHVKEFISNNFARVRNAAKSHAYSRSIVSAWKRNAVLPLKIFKAFRSEINQENILLKADKKSKLIPASVKVDENFLQIAGLWLADGSYDGKYGVIISTPDCSVQISQFAAKLGLNARKHSDGISYILSNTTLNLFFRKVLGLEGNAYTKNFPKWTYNLSKPQLAHVIKGLLSGDGCVSKSEIVIALCSKSLIESLQLLFLAFGIVCRATTRPKESDKTYSCRISSLKMLKSYQSAVGFMQESKNSKLSKLCSKVSTHDTTDIIPFTAQDKQQLSYIIENFNRHDYITKGNQIGRKRFSAMVTAIKDDRAILADLKVLLESEVFWDEVKEITNLGCTEQFVYDFSVPSCESFLCNGIIAHNTLELPGNYLKSIGFNIQRLKTRSPIGARENDSEIAPEEALRTALRLGDSALIVGEVRSKEAKVLYEAMRVGAAGNIVMGTIHGDSAYSVWDRVVNDLEVPNTSFKATDIVVVARPIRFKGSLERHRRIVQVTEVKKHWITDPEREGGLLDLMTYDAKKDNLELLEDNLKESNIFSKISGMSGLTIDQIWKSIRMNGESKGYLVELKNQLKLPELLEAENTVAANNKLMLLKEDQLEEYGSVDYNDVLGEWKNWVKNYLVKRIKRRHS